MKITRIIRLCLCAMLPVILFSEFYHFLASSIRTGSLNNNKVELYFSNIEHQSDFVNLYGCFQYVLGKRQIERFTIFKNKYNKLVEPRNLIAIETLEEKITDIQPIWSELNDLEIPFLYIEPPLPIADISDLPCGVVDYSERNARLLHEKLSIQTMDINEITALHKEELFYRTDHHWSGDTAFETYKAARAWLKSKGLMNTYFAETDFKRTSVDHFLGSYGVKVGKYYDGEDQYIYYQPSSEDTFTCITMTADGEVIAEHQGQWLDALMDTSMLDDPEYHNKYNAALWGNGGENRIINHSIDTGKLLIISHSYGRPLAQYFALDFHEVRQIDPQEGRFNGNYLTYIDDYNPDAVIFLVEFEGEIIGEYRTGD